MMKWYGSVRFLYYNNLVDMIPFLTCFYYSVARTTHAATRNVQHASATCDGTARSADVLGYTHASIVSMPGTN